MKRPLAVSGFALGIGAFIASLFNYKIALLLCALLGLAFIVCLLVKSFRNSFVICAIIFLGLGLTIGGLNLYLPAKTSQSLSGKEINDAVFTHKETIGRTMAVGFLELNDKTTVNVLVIGTSTTPYNKYIISGTLEEISGTYKNYYLSRNTRLQITPDKIIDANKTGGNPILRAADFIREKCSQKLYEYLPQKEASVIDALFLGNKSALSSRLLENFRASGAAHVAVVSGMHLSVISSVILGILLFITKKRRLSCVVSMTGVACFMLVTGLTMSVTRAGIMAIIMLCGGLFARRGDSLNSLGAAVLIITALNPLSVLDIGFQLSVVSTLGIITVGSYAIKSLQKYSSTKTYNIALKYIITPAVISLSAFIATAPIVIIDFEYIGIYFIVTNILLSGAVPLLLLLSLLFTVFVFIPQCSFIFYPLGLISGLIAKFISYVVTSISKLPYAVLQIDLIYKNEIIIFLILFVTVITAIKRTRKSLIKASLCAVMAFCLIFSAFTVFKSDKAKLSLLSTGNGITAVLEKNGETAVISCGGSSNRSAFYSKLSNNSKRCLLTVRGGTKECGGLFSIVQNSCFCENYYIQNNSYNKRIIKSLDSSRVNTYSKQCSIKLWERFDLKIIPLEKSSAEVIELDEMYILLMPNPEYANKLPLKYRNPELLISTKPIDKSIINADKMIITCSKSLDSENKENNIYNDKTISLYQHETIDICFSDKIYFTKMG